mgnify:FL=1
MAVGSDGGLYDESVPVGLGGKILGTIGIDTPNSHRANTSWTDAAKTSAANFFPGLVEGALAPFKVMHDNPDPRTMSNTDRAAVALGTFGAQGLGSALASGRGMLGRAGAKAGLADPNMRGNAANAALASGDERASAAAAFMDHNIPWDDLPDAPARSWDFSEVAPEALEPDAPSSPFIAGTKKDGTPKTTVRGAQRQEFPGITDSETPGTGYGSGAVTGEVIKAFEKLSPEMQARIDASPALRESFIQRIMTDEEASASGAGTLRDDIQNMRLRLALGGFSGLRGDLADGALLPAGGLPGTLLTSGPFSYAHREEEPE